MVKVGDKKYIYRSGNKYLVELKFRVYNDKKQPIWVGVDEKGHPIFEALMKNKRGRRWTK